MLPELCQSDVGSRRHPGQHPGLGLIGTPEWNPDSADSRRNRWTARRPGGRSRRAMLASPNRSPRYSLRPSCQAGETSRYGCTIPAGTLAWLSVLQRARWCTLTVAPVISGRAASRPSEICIAQVSLLHHRPVQVGLPHIGPPQVGALQVCPGDLDLLQRGHAAIGRLQPGPFLPPPLQVGTATLVSLSRLRSAVRTSTPRPATPRRLAERTSAHRSARRVPCARRLSDRDHLGTCA